MPSRVSVGESFPGLTIRRLVPVACQGFRVLVAPGEPVSVPLEVRNRMLPRHARTSVGMAPGHLPRPNVS